MTHPNSTQVVVLTRSSEGEKHHYDIVLQTRDVPKELKDDEVLVRMVAVGYNRREVWQTQNLYPDTTPGVIIGADGAGLVIASSSTSDPLLRKRVFLVPIRGWISDLHAPESRFGILGGTSYPGIGTFSEYVIVKRDEVIEVPQHLDWEEAAAWPVAGLTAWRAVVVKAQVRRGQNILITGIGGGVAVTALQICVALGANAWVTSGDGTKITQAIGLGAKGGVNYRRERWPDDLAQLMKENRKNTLLDAVIDSAGGDICQRTFKLLRGGGVVVCYGMTSSPTIPFTMRQVLKNVELKGSTMGSHQELVQATEFMSKHKIVPIVGHVVHGGLKRADEGMDILRQGNQMGKVVLRIADSELTAKL